MSAAVCYESGASHVLRNEKVDNPAPKDHELLIQIKAATVTTAGCMMRSGDTLPSRLILGWRRPKKKYPMMGIEPAGIVEQAGSTVTRFKPADLSFEEHAALNSCPVFSK